MSISSSRASAWSAGAGFTLIELLVALALALVLALACAPLWISVQRVGVSAADRVIWSAQARVAAARLERDLRLAGVGLDVGSGDTVALGGPLIFAASHQLVVVTRSPADGSAQLVEWEIAGGNVMRRRGPWQTSALASPTDHSHYVDHKTMLENVSDSSVFSVGRRVPGQAWLTTESVTGAETTVSTEDLRWIDTVSCRLLAADPADGTTRGLPVESLLWVAR